MILPHETTDDDLAKGLRELAGRVASKFDRELGYQRRDWYDMLMLAADRLETLPSRPLPDGDKLEAVLDALREAGNECDDAMNAARDARWAVMDAIDKIKNATNKKAEEAGV